MRLKGYWHMPAFGLAAAILSAIHGTLFFYAAAVCWAVVLVGIRRVPVLPAMLLFCVLFFFHFSLPAGTSPENQPLLTKKHSEKQFKGKIVSNVNVTGKAVRFAYLLENTPYSVQVVYFPQSDEELPQTFLKAAHHGAACILRGEWSQPEPATNPGQFDFASYARKQGFSSQIRLTSPSEITCSGRSLLSRLHEIRSVLSSSADRKLNPDTAAWLNALVLGDASALDDETTALFQRWGLSHLLAISGLHVGIILAFLYMLLVKTGMVTRERAEWALAVFLPIYAVVAGGAPSVWRAGLMAAAAILLKKQGYRLASADIISLVFLCLAAVNPNIVYHIGFQLSFFVAFGIMLSQQWIAAAESALIRLFRISFAAQMMIIPLQISYFYELQPLSIAVNTLIVPYFSLFVIPLMFVLLLFMLLPIPQFLFAFIEKTFSFCQHAVLSGLKTADHYLDSPLIPGELALGSAICYMILFVLFMHLAEKESRTNAFFMGLAMTALLLLNGLQPYLSSQGRVTMLDIGQGDAFVIELPYRSGVIMIDAGARFSFPDMEATDKVHREVLGPYLKSRGIRQIDALFLSHEDLDHDGSVPFLMNDIKVKEMVTGPYYKPSEDIAVAVKKHGVRTTVLGSGEKIFVGSQAFYALGPIKQTDSANENSLILYGEIGGKRWLFTGDSGKETEDLLLRAYPGLQVDILKVGHHGSRHSTSEHFVAGLQPQTALISAGRRNRYGHPSGEVLDILGKHETQIYRTDRSGAVQYIFRAGEKGTFRVFHP